MTKNPLVETIDRGNRIDRTRLHQQVADRIRAAILRGDLAPGDSLPTERDLSASFGVGRTSIREALRSLEAQGLVSLGAGGRWPAVVTTDVSGPFREMLVHLVRLERIGLADVIELRTAVESAAVTRAAQTPDPEQLKQAARALREMQQQDLSLEDFDAADVRFHVALVAASGNPAMHLVILAVSAAVATYLLDALRSVPNVRTTIRSLVDEHAAILQAIDAGDGTLAATLVRDHIEGFYGRFMRGSVLSERVR
jgi:DNA-binding FadR family transcriptional regulator